MCQYVYWRRTEQAKANLDPRVGPRVAPRVGPGVAPRVCPREHPRGPISLFSAFKDSPRNLPRRCPRKGPRVDGRGSPVLFSPVLFFDQFRRPKANIWKFLHFLAHHSLKISTNIRIQRCLKHRNPKIVNITQSTSQGNSNAPTKRLFLKKPARLAPWARKK